jgi:hypothetical protein
MTLICTPFRTCRRVIFPTYKNTFRPVACLFRSCLLLAGPVSPHRNACPVLLAYVLGPIHYPIVTLILDTFHIHAQYACLNFIIGLLDWPDFLPSQPPWSVRLPRFSTYRVCFSACLAFLICSSCFPAGRPPRKAMSSQPSAWTTSLIFFQLLPFLVFPLVYSYLHNLLVEIDLCICHIDNRVEIQREKVSVSWEFRHWIYGFAKCEMVPLIWPVFQWY